MLRRSPLLVAALVTVTSCGVTGTGPSGSTESPAATLPSFTAERDWTDADTLALGDNDDFDSFLMGGPYYGGRQGYPVPALEEYATLRASTVQDAISRTERLGMSAAGLQDATARVQEAVITFLADAVATDKKTGKEAMRPIADAFVSARVKEEALAAAIAAIDPPEDAPLVSAALQYRRTVLTLELAATVQEDFARSIGICARLSAASAGASEAVQQLAATLDATCGKVAFGEPLLALVTNVEELGDVLSDLDAADALFARAAVDATKLQVADLQAKVDGLLPRDGLDAETIALAKEQLAAMRGVLTQLDATVETPAPLAYEAGFFPVARADGYLSSAFETLKSGAKLTVAATKTAASYTWTGVKAVASVAQTTAGVGLDLTKAAVDSTTDAILGITDGKTVSEIAQTTKGHFQTVASNYQSCISGAQVYKDAGALLDGVEKAGQQVAADAVASKVGGPGWTSWIAGHVAKTSVGIFTGFGKGIYKIADPTSTKGQVAEGALEVGLSFVGGSKVFVKGSQLLKGTPPAVKGVALETLTAMEQQAAASEIALLKSINAKILKSAKPSAADVQRLIMNSEAIAAKEALVATLTAANSRLTTALADLAAKGGSAIWKNLTTGAKKSFSDFVKESFVSSLRGYLKQLATAPKTALTTAFDELISEKGDDLIQALARSAIDGLPLYGAVDFTGTYEGTWDTGTATMPFVLKVEGSAITPSIRYSETVGRATSSVTIGGSGTVGEDGAVSGTLSGTTSLSGGAQKVMGSASGSFSGTMSATECSITGSVTAEFAGERAVFPIALSLRRK